MWLTDKEKEIALKGYNVIERGESLWGKGNKY